MHRVSAMIFRRKLILIAYMICLATPALTVAQEQGAPANNEEAAKAPVPKVAPREPAIPAPKFDAPVIPEPVPDPIIIQGSVITEDGSPPPFGTVIERDCGTVVTKEVLVNANGFYSFFVGDEHRAGNLMADAGENYFKKENRDIWGYYDPGRNNQNRDPSYERDLFGCVLRARHVGFDSTTAQLGLGIRSGIIDASTIVMYPSSRIKGNAVSITNLEAPKEAKKALKKGREAFAKQEFEEAEKLYRSALKHYPKYSEAWVELGWLFQKLKRNEDALQAYRNATDIDPTYVSPHIRLAQLYASEGKWEDSLKCSKEALALDPVSYPQTYFLNGLAYYSLDQLDRAEEVIRRGIRLDTDSSMPKMHLVLANILTRKKDLSGSLDSLRKYLAIAPDASDAVLIKSMIKEREKNIRASSEAASLESR